MTPADLQVALRDLVASAATARGADVSLTDADLVLERPRTREHGDWASTVAMRVGKRIGVAPRDLAAELAAGLQRAGRRRRRRRRRPRLHQHHARGREPRASSPADRRGGRGVRPRPTAAGLRMNLEFVSANPTGPVHLGGTRWAAVGDSLARILRAAGAEVAREYYFNDHGAQIDRFAASLLAAHLGEPTPEDGYGGAYIGEIAARRRRRAPGGDSFPSRRARPRGLPRVGVDLMFGDIQQSLHDFGVDFDVYFHENSLHESRPPSSTRCSASATRPHLRGRRRDLAAHHRVRRRQRPRSCEATARPPTSPATSPTT